MKRWDEIRQMLQVRSQDCRTDADYDAAKMQALESAILALIFELERFFPHRNKEAS